MLPNETGDRLLRFPHLSLPPRTHVTNFMELMVQWMCYSHVLTLSQTQQHCSFSGLLFVLGPLPTVFLLTHQELALMLSSLASPLTSLRQFVTCPLHPRGLIHAFWRHVALLLSKHMSVSSSRHGSRKRQSMLCSLSVAPGTSSEREQGRRDRHTGERNSKGLPRL